MRWPPEGGPDSPTREHTRCGQLTLSLAPWKQFLQLPMVGLVQGPLSTFLQGHLQTSLSHRIKIHFFVILCPEQEEGGSATPGGPCTRLHRA